jgi:ribonucleotide reductase alpha subunit
MRLPFDSKQARVLNKDIFETLYFAALTASNELAQELGHYSSMKKPHPETGEIAPIAHGIFQFELHYQYQEKLYKKYGPKLIPKPDSDAIYPSSGMWDWDALRAKVKQYGVRNSLLLAPMPTASTSQILGNTESFEPITSNIYIRRTLAGEFVCVSKYLIQDLINLGLWSDTMKSKLIAHNGDVQNINEIPNDIKAIYRTVWNIPQRNIIEMAASRQAFIDQSQSLNIYMANINIAKLSSMHFFGFSLGLKCGQYYLRGKPAVDAVKFSIDPAFIKEQQERVDKPSIPMIEQPVRNRESLERLALIGTTKREPLQIEQEVKSDQEQHKPSETLTLTQEQRLHKEKQMECSIQNPLDCQMCGS